MQFDKTEPVLAEAFRLIETHDPDTYAAMVAEDWVVSRWIDEAFPESWPYVMNDPNSPMAYGITLSSDSDLIDIPQSETFLNVPMIEFGARQTHTRVGLLAAETLVHEFKHVRGGATNDQIFAPGGEHDASVAGVAFSHLLVSEPQSRPVIDMAEQHLRENS